MNFNSHHIHAFQGDAIDMRFAKIVTRASAGELLVRRDPSLLKHQTRAPNRIGETVI